MIAGQFFLVRSGEKLGVYDFGSYYHLDTQFDEIIVKDKKNKTVGFEPGGLYSVYMRRGEQYASIDVNINKLIKVPWANECMFATDVILKKAKIKTRKLNKLNFPEDVYKIGGVIGQSKEEEQEYIEVQKYDEYYQSGVFALYDSIEFVDKTNLVKTFRKGKVGLFDPCKGMLRYTVYDSIIFRKDSAHEAWLNGLKDESMFLGY